MERSRDPFRVKLRKYFKRMKIIASKALVLAANLRRTSLSLEIDRICEFSFAIVQSIVKAWPMLYNRGVRIIFNK